MSLNTGELRKRLASKLGWNPTCWEDADLVENGKLRKHRKVNERTSDYALTKREFYYLAWPGFDKKESTWWQREDLKSFSMLSVDFNQRVAAAVARLKVQRDEPAPGKIHRELGAANDNRWFATFAGSWRRIGRIRGRGEKGAQSNE